MKKVNAAPLFEGIAYRPDLSGWVIAHRRQCYFIGDAELLEAGLDMAVAHAAWCWLEYRVLAARTAVMQDIQIAAERARFDIRCAA